MNKLKSFIKSDVANSSNLAPTTKHSLKPLKRTHMNIVIEEEDYDEDVYEVELIRKKTIKHRIKNPKWASLSFDLNYSSNDFDEFNLLSKFKSLNLLSIKFVNRQDGYSLGQFMGKIGYIEKKSRHLKRLWFTALVRGKRRFNEQQHWIANQKQLTDLILVPYWVCKSDEDDKDRNRKVSHEKPGGVAVARLVNLVSRQIKNLGFEGSMIEDLRKNLNFCMLKRAKSFSLKTESNPYYSDGESTPFRNSDLEMIKKALKIPNLERLTLFNEDDQDTQDKFYTSLAEVLAPMTKPFIIEVRIQYDNNEMIYEFLMENIPKMLPPNIKFTYNGAILAPEENDDGTSSSDSSD